MAHLKIENQIYVKMIIFLDWQKAPMLEYVNFLVKTPQYDAVLKVNRLQLTEKGYSDCARMPYFLSMTETNVIF